MQHYTEGLDIAQRQKFFYVSSLLLPEMMRLCENMGDTAKALHYAQLQITQSNEAAQELQSSGFTYLDYIINERTLREAQSRQAAQKQLIYLLILLTLVSGGLLFFVYRSRWQSRKVARIQQELRRRQKKGTANWKTGTSSTAC